MNRMKGYIYGILGSVLLLGSCTVDDSKFIETVNNPDHLHNAMNAYTDVIIHDIFSPPQASRNYVYPSIAAYEVQAKFDKTYQSIQGDIRTMPTIPSPEDTSVYSGLATLEAFLASAKNFIFSEVDIEKYRDELYGELQKNSYDKKKWKNSISYGQQVSQIIIDWSNTDNYKESRSFPKYTIKDEPSRWKPTPPGYMEGIEPSWKMIRPMVLDSANQFVPDPPTLFDMQEGSKFHRELLEVYETVKNVDAEKKEIASFWDCNPYVMNLTGHVMYATKKITPGGHWMGISAIASQKANDNLAQATATYAKTSIALFDGFISCWDEKYRSNLVRPETIINEFIDKTWVPLLQTPPFPEHTSGHSVISTAAAMVLTDIYGDNFKFDDSVELKFGMPVRHFDSFIKASEEAAISRLYGGIHYMPAITYGQVQGRSVGALINQRVSFQ